MESVSPALYFKPWKFQPKTERLISLFGSFRRFGYKTVIIDWGGLFPWSERLFRSRFCYPEHAVVKAYAQAADAGVELYSRLPCGSGMGNFLSHPAYRSLRRTHQDPETIGATAIGATAFICELLSDMLSLLPGLQGVYIDPVADGGVDADYITKLLKDLLPRLHEQAPELSLIGAPYLKKQGFPIDLCKVLPSPPDDFVRDAPTVFPPTVELYFDKMPTACTLEPCSELDEREGVASLRQKLLALGETLRGSWEYIREVEETFCLPASLGFSPGIVCSKVRRAVVLLKKQVDELFFELLEVLAGLKPLVYPGIVEAWVASRTKPIEEQIFMLEQRANALEVWIEAE